MKRSSQSVAWRSVGLALTLMMSPSIGARESQAVPAEPAEHRGKIQYHHAPVGKPPDKLQVPETAEGRSDLLHAIMGMPDRIERERTWNAYLLKLDPAQLRELADRFHPPGSDANYVASLEMLTALARVDWHAAVAWVERAGDDAVLSYVGAGWAVSDPEAALAWAQKDIAVDAVRTDTLYQILLTVERSHPGKGLGMLHGLADEPLRRKLFDSVFPSLTLTSGVPQALLAAAADDAERSGLSGFAERQQKRAAGGAIPAAVMRAMSQRVAPVLAARGDLEEARDLYALMDDLEPADFPALIGILKASEAGREGSAAVTALAYWSRFDREGALKWTPHGTHDEAVVLEGWSEQDPEAAYRWAAARGPAGNPYFTLDCILARMAVGDMSRAMAEWRRLHPAPERVKYVTDFTETIGRMPPGRWREWLGLLGAREVEVAGVACLIQAIPDFYEAEEFALLADYPEVCEGAGFLSGMPPRELKRRVGRLVSYLSKHGHEDTARSLKERFLDHHDPLGPGD